METIQVVLDQKLLKAADTAAKREKVNRSALIRKALEEHLKRLHMRDLEDAIDAVTRLSRSEQRNTCPGRAPQLGRKIESRCCPSLPVRASGQRATGAHTDPRWSSRPSIDGYRCPDYLHCSGCALGGSAGCRRRNEKTVRSEPAQCHHDFTRSLGQASRQSDQSAHAAGLRSTTVLARMRLRRPCANLIRDPAARLIPAVSRVTGTLANRGGLFVPYLANTFCEIGGRPPCTIRCERLASSQSLLREPGISFDLPDLQDVPLRVG